LGIFAAGAVLIALQATSFSNLLERGLTKMLVFLEVIALSYSSIFCVLEMVYPLQPNRCETILSPFVQKKNMKQALEK